MDLTKQPPRRPTNLAIAGMAGVARMADKARAHNNETLGEYLYGNDSGLDKKVLDFFGLSAEAFADSAEEQGDETLSRWLLSQVEKTKAGIEAFNQQEVSLEPKDDWHKQMLRERVAKYAPERTDIKTVLQSMELDDWGSFWPVDLQHRPPRSPHCRDVAGMFGLARMADKARAAQYGKVGEYKYGQRSALDQYLLDFLGISEDLFQQGAVANPNDLELGERIFSHAAVNADQIMACNQQAREFGMQSQAEVPAEDNKPYQVHANRENFIRRRNEVTPGQTEITNWLELMDYDDQKSFGIIDLARRAPRSCYSQEIAGIAHLDRLVDKGRAFNDGTLGDYWYGKDSGLDRYLLAFLKIRVDEFTDQLKHLSTDQDVVDWIKQSSSRTSVEIEDYNQRMVELGPADEEKWAFFHQALNKLDPSRTNIKTYFDLVDLEDEKNFQFP